MYPSMCASIATGARDVPCRGSRARQAEGPWGSSPSGRILAVMFVRYYLDIAAPFTDVEAAVLDDPGTWVPGLFRAAEDRGQHLLAEVGFAVDTRRIDTTGRDRDSARLSGPVEDRAADEVARDEARGLIPALDADVEVASLGPDRTQLSISARYRAPMGAVGRMLDRALLHRVAEATVKDFLDRVGERLSASELAKSER